MMKKLILLCEFYRKNIVAVLFLLIFMSVSIFHAVELLGYISFKTYSLHMMDKLNLTDGIYCMPASVDSSLYDIVTAQSSPAISNIINPPMSSIGYGDNVANIIICDDAFIEQFNFADEGDWLTESKNDAAQPIEIVAGGSLFADVLVGDMIDLSVYNLDNSFNRFETVKIIGKDMEPTMGFQLGITNSSVTAAEIFTNDSNTIYMTEDSFSRIYHENISSVSNNFIICFNPAADAPSKQAIIDLVASHGKYITLDDIQQTSKTDLANLLRERLPQPFFMLLISTYAMISVAVLLTNKQMYDYRIYYLVGCTRKQSFVITFLSIMLIGFVAGGINVLYLSILSQHFVYVRAQNAVKYYNYLVLNNHILFIWLFIIFVVLISVLIPFRILKKNTTIDLYRRTE